MIGIGERRYEKWVVRTCLKYTWAETQPEAIGAALSGVAGRFQNCNCFCNGPFSGLQSLLGDQLEHFLRRRDFPVSRDYSNAGPYSMGSHERFHTLLYESRVPDCASLVKAGVRSGAVHTWSRSPQRLPRRVAR